VEHILVNFDNFHLNTKVATSPGGFAIIFGALALLDLSFLGFVGFLLLFQLLALLRLATFTPFSSFPSGFAASTDL